MKIILACTLLIHCAYAFEYQVAFLVGDEERFLCGGCILNTQVILTAAHCFDKGYDPEDLKVLAGSNMVADDDTRQLVKVATYVSHSEYLKGKTYHDIAVVFLAEKLWFNEYVKALDLPQPNTIPKGKAKFAGWSQPDSTGQVRPLQGGYLNIVAYFDCLTKEDKMATDTIMELDTIICTERNKKIKIEDGDSGTPLVQDNTVIGIVEGPSERPHKTRSFIRVSEFVEWIREKLSTSGVNEKSEL